jgi:hypothetical protein
MHPRSTRRRTRLRPVVPREPGATPATLRVSPILPRHRAVGPPRRLALLDLSPSRLPLLLTMTLPRRIPLSLSPLSMDCLRRRLSSRSIAPATGCVTTALKGAARQPHHRRGQLRLPRSRPRSPLREPSLVHPPRHLSTLPPSVHWRELDRSSSFRSLHYKTPLSPRIPLYLLRSTFPPRRPRTRRSRLLFSRPHPSTR